jgi:flavodoxin
MNTPIPRRTLLTGGLLLGASTWIGTAACSAPDSPPSTLETITAEPTMSPAPTGAGTAPRTLLAYFSRTGENYYYGGRRDLEVGNTEVLARMISELIDCDVHRIDAADPYPAGYDATVARNVREQDADARPKIANPLASIGQYDVVLLGSPIWNVRAPMIMSTFTDSHDFTGKTVHPFVTYAVSGLGSIERDYATACPKARIGAGLAVRGEEVPQHRPDVETWLREARLPA